MGRVKNARTAWRGLMGRDTFEALSAVDLGYLRSVEAMNRNLVALARRVKPHVSVVDAFTAMHREGPKHGTPVKLGTVIAGTDAVAVDAVAAAVMGFDPLRIGYLRYAQEAGLGVADLTRINVLGDPIDRVKRALVPHSNHAVQRHWDRLPASGLPRAAQPGLLPRKGRLVMTRAGAGGQPVVSIVLASIEARATIALSLARFLEEAACDGEVILVDASRDESADHAESLFPGLRILRRPPGTLAPELWRDGLNASRAPLVAFSTAQMTPALGWLAALRDRLESTGAAAVGGPIEPSVRLSPADRAVYLLRYVNYLRPLPDAGRRNPPATTRSIAASRSQGSRRPGTLDSGKWKSIAGFALEGRRWSWRRRVRPRSSSMEAGDCPWPCVSRRDHARHYGAARGGRMNAGERLIRSVAAPLIPAILIRRIAATLAGRGRRLGPWLPACPRCRCCLRRGRRVKRWEPGWDLPGKGEGEGEGGRW